MEFFVFDGNRDYVFLISIILKVILISFDNNYYIREVNFNFEDYFVDVVLLMENKLIWKGERINLIKIDDEVKYF